MLTQTLYIQGMTCAACSARLEKVLNKLNGVKKASVSLAAEKASITYDPGAIQVSGLLQAVDGAGFTASEQKPEKKKA